MLDEWVLPTLADCGGIGIRPLSREVHANSLVVRIRLGDDNPEMRGFIVWRRAVESLAGLQQIRNSVDCRRKAREPVSRQRGRSRLPRSPRVSCSRLAEYRQW